MGLDIKQIGKFVPVAFEVMDVVRAILGATGHKSTAEVLTAAQAAFSVLDKAAEGTITYDKVHDELAKYLEEFDSVKAALYRELHDKFNPGS